ncbi:MAG: hypothetical protein K2N63_10110, partial [Lachnospiraceae bacterium]|nr:hypothetical protein [Lachnospiraceae bacterium]
SYPNSNFQDLYDSSGNAASMVDITASVGGVEIDSSGIPNDWRPTEPTIFHLATLEDLEYRGNLTNMIFILISALVLLLDICFPRLFFYLRHSLSVSNPEPSDLYYFFQKIGRVALLVLIGFLMLMTFFSR